MKKLLTILGTALFITLIAPACSSGDEDFEEISSHATLDQTAPKGPGDEGHGDGSGPG